MNKKYQKISAIIFLFLSIFILSLFVHSGTFDVPIKLIFKIRLNKIVAIIMASFSIGFATYILQRSTRNNIVDISFFGIASFNLMVLSVVYFYFYTMVDRKFIFMTLLPIMSLGVSILLTAIIFLLTLRKNSTNRKGIVLIGIFLNYVFMGIAYVFIKKLPMSDASSLMEMLLGSVREFNSALMVFSIATLLLISVIWYISISKKIYILNANTKLAEKLGIKNRFVQVQTIFIVGINAAISFSLMGAVSFLGIVAANLAIKLIGNKKSSAIVSGLIASIICAGAHLLFVLILDYSYPLGMIATAISIPYFLYRMAKG